MTNNLETIARIGCGALSLAWLAASIGVGYMDYEYVKAYFSSQVYSSPLPILAVGSALSGISVASVFVSYILGITAVDKNFKRFKL